jgi:hypothetical protein
MLILQVPNASHFPEVVPSYNRFSFAVNNQFKCALHHTHNQGIKKEKSEEFWKMFAEMHRARGWNQY